MSRIYTGNDKAIEMGYKNFREMMQALMVRGGFGISSDIGGEAVFARVDFGRWVADCECGGASYVEPRDPVFFCTSCGNVALGGIWRRVIFPDNREEIEAELLMRLVYPPKNRKPVDAAMNAVSKVPGLARCWRPGETVAELKRQRSKI